MGRIIPPLHGMLGGCVPLDVKRRSIQNRNYYPYPHPYPYSYSTPTRPHFPLAVCDLTRNALFKHLAPWTRITNGAPVPRRERVAGARSPALIN